MMQPKFKDQKLCDHLQPKIQCRGSVHHVSHLNILLCSGIREKCIPWGYNTRRLNEILEIPYSFLPLLFQTLCKWTIFSENSAYVPSFVSYHKFRDAMSWPWHAFVYTLKLIVFIPALLQGNAYTMRSIFHIGALFVQVGFERSAAISQVDTVCW